jgi:Xaa-Pro dipeptidase
MAGVNGVNGPVLDELYAYHVADLQRRVEGVLGEEGWDGIAIHSGSLVKRSTYDDQTWPLRPCPHFQHWLALAEPDALLVVKPGRRPVLLRPGATSFWEKPALPESDAFASAMEVVVANPANARLHVGVGRVAFVGEDPAAAERWGVPRERACPPRLIAALDELRTTKTPYEIACLVEANRRARAGHEALRAAFAAGDDSELDLHLLFLRATAQDDWETPYKNIVAIGVNAATLHHVAYRRHTSERQAGSLLVDAGATCAGYGSDITRTWVRGPGAAVGEFAHLTEEVDRIQRQLCAAVRVGTPYEQLHDESHRLVGAVLREVGLATGSVEEIVASGVSRAFYPHGLGHSLGLQTHDVGCSVRLARPDNPFLRNTADVTVGQVFTIEPGIYFIDALLAALRATPAGKLVDWALVDALAPLGGVRIEDDIHVVGGDAVVRNLTREHLPVGGGWARSP